MNRRRSWEKLSLAVAIAIVVDASSNIVQAATLTGWEFDQTKNRLEIILESEATPRYFVLAEPPRIVVDFPDTELGKVDIEQNYSGLVRQIRVSQFQEGITRIVVELAPEVVLAPQQVQFQQVEIPSGNQSRWVLRPLIVEPDSLPSSGSVTTLPPSSSPNTPTEATVSVPPLNPTEGSTSSTSPTSAPPSQPPATPPTNQDPTVRVPDLQTTTPETPSSPARRTPIIEFGQPLPKTAPTP